MGLSGPELVGLGVLHPTLAGIVDPPDLFSHQWETLERVQEGRHCLVSKGSRRAVPWRSDLAIGDHEWIKT